MAIDVSGFNVPELQQRDNKGLDQLVALNERNKDKAAALAERQAEFQQRQSIAEQQRLRENRVAGQNVVDKELDPNKWNIGEKVFDTTINSELQKARDKFSEMARSGVDQGLISQAVHNYTGNLSQIYTAGKNDLNKLKEAKGQLAKDYPDADQLALSGSIDNKFLDTYLNKDEATGQINGFKPVGQILSSPSNYLQDVSSPEGIAPYLKGTSALDKHITENVKNTNTTLAANAETNAAGHVTFNGGLGEYSPLYAQPKLDNKGRVIGVEPKKDEFLTGYDANGNPTKIPMATDEQFEKLKGDKQAFAAFNNYFQKKLPVIESEMSPDGKKPIDPTSLEKLQKAAYYHYIKDNAFNVGQYVEHRPQVAPLTKNIFNMGNKEEPVINNVYAEIADKISNRKGAMPVNELSTTAQKILVNYVKDIKGKIQDGTYENGSPKMREYNQGDITLDKDENGNVGIYSVAKNNKGQDASYKLIAPLSEFDINHIANKGLGSKIQQKVLKNENNLTWAERQAQKK